MEMTADYLVLGLLVLGINVVPAFMPPTWMILTFYYLRYNLDLIPVVLVGASCATAGRIILTVLSRYYLRPIFPKGTKENLDSLGAFLSKKQQLTATIVLTYAFLPIPSNQVFITAGLARVNISIIAFSFFMGRMISYTVWVSLASRVSDNLESLLASHYTKINSFILEVLSLVLMVIVINIGWKRVLKRISKEH